MSTDRRRVLELFHQALGQDAAGRSAFLREAAAGNEELYRDVEAMLALEPPAEFLGPSAETDDELIGKQVGLYRVESRLGSGGMGHVFRAHDTRLGRDVALKILPRTFATDPERRSRFEREARLLATLNHPHIAAIYGVEDVEGVPALVLELVDGVTLANHVKRRHTSSGRGLPVPEALQIAQQIAEALEAAHERGIVHRDLKPTNILLTEAGSVKVLDFGLAKALFEADAGPNATDTRTGIVMGTPAYMSPEQTRGVKVDRRADVWAFGCVLFEMLAGRPAFSGDSIPETLAAVLHAQPDWTALPADVPASVRMALESCLQKDPAARLRDIGDVRLAMSGVFTAPARPSEPSDRPFADVSLRRPGWRRAGPVAAGFAVGVLAAAATFFARDTPDPPAAVTRLALGTRGAAALHVQGGNLEFAITPDGSRVVYVGDGGRRIFVRALDRLEPVAIATGTLLNNPFVSPDGQWVGYSEGFQGLKKVPISGGPVVEIVAGILRGAVWLADDTIVFASGGQSTGLQRVSARGGTRQVLTTPDASRNEYDHFWPAALPDGRGVLYTVLARTGGLSAAKLAVYDLETNTSTDLLAGASNAVHLRSGHLAYVAGGTLWTVPFDAGRRSITGKPSLAMKLTAATATGAGNFAVSATGTLAYVHAPGYDPFARTLSWIDRATGKIESLDAPEHPYMQPQISHDGTRVVHGTGRGPENNIWVLDIGRRALTRLRNEASRDQLPSWSLDDRWIFYASDRAGTDLQIWRQASDGTGEPELVVDAQAASATVTPDGSHLLFHGYTSSTLNDIMRMALDGSRRVSPLVQTRFAEDGALVSPDGRWLAYQSTLSGRQEVYVSPYPDATSGRWAVSVAGGNEPLWRRDGRELFYTAPDGSVMSVQVKTTGSTWAATSPVRVLESGYWSSDALIGRQYDISPDGKRFLVVTPSRATPDPPDLVVEQHWLGQLKATLGSK